ncbi:MAG TPA: hypothetical protein DEP28_08150 [Bacteroidetes bacterium]|nr:hypothetical protein [Bacteroidota bacterium]
MNSNLENIELNRSKFNLLKSLKPIFSLKVILVVSYIYFSVLLIQITLQYIPYNTDVAFLRIKQDAIEVPFNKITIFIDSISGELMYGHSVVAGNERPFKGKFLRENENYKVIASEPGDDKYDGEFSFTIIPGENKIKGVWDTYDKKLLVTKREYELSKFTFTYNPNRLLPNAVSWRLLYNSDDYLKNNTEREFLTDDVLKVNASSQILTKNDVENMYKGDLEIIRNSIYARHGYNFKNENMRAVFYSTSWHWNIYDNVEHRLTEIEKKNIEMIKRFEEHAERFYLDGRR